MAQFNTTGDGNVLMMGVSRHEATVWGEHRWILTSSSLVLTPDEARVAAGELNKWADAAEREIPGRAMAPVSPGKDV